jgi:hypothetical protein
MACGSPNAAVRMPRNVRWWRWRASCRCCCITCGRQEQTTYPCTRPPSHRDSGSEGGGADTNNSELLQAASGRLRSCVVILEIDTKVAASDVGPYSAPGPKCPMTSADRSKAIQGLRRKGGSPRRTFLTCLLIEDHGEDSGSTDGKHDLALPSVPPVSPWRETVVRNKANVQIADC